MPNHWWKADVNIFVETRLCMSDKDDAYILSGFTLSKNDFQNFNIGTCYELPYTLKMI